MGRYTGSIDIHADPGKWLFGSKLRVDTASVPLGRRKRVAAHTPPEAVDGGSGRLHEVTGDEDVFGLVRVVEGEDEEAGVAESLA